MSPGGTPSSESEHDLMNADDADKIGCSAGGSASGLALTSRLALPARAGAIVLSRSSGPLTCVERAP